MAPPLPPPGVPLWAGLFLSEKITWVIYCGILLTILGAIVVKLKVITLEEIKKVFSFHKDYKSARFALLASFMYSIGATLDKSRIATFDLPVYVFLILSLMTFNMFVFDRFNKSFTMDVFKHNIWPVLFGGIMVFLSFYFFRKALQHVFVSIATPVRLTSIIFAVLLAVIVLKEKLAYGKILGIILIIAGIIVINLEL